MRQSWETMTSISAGHIILTPTQPVGSGRPQRGSNPEPPDQESRATAPPEGEERRDWLYKDEKKKGVEKKIWEDSMSE